MAKSVMMCNMPIGIAAKVFEMLNPGKVKIECSPWLEERRYIQTDCEPTEESEIAPIKEKNLVGTKIEASQLPNDIYVDTSKGDLYRLSQQNLNDMGLSKIEITNDNYYVVQYDIENIKIDVINTEGYKLDGKMYYSLSQMEKDGV